MGEDYVYDEEVAAATAEPGEGAGEQLVAAAPGEGESAASAPLGIDTPAPLSGGEQDAIMARLRGLRRGSQRAVLSSLLGGEMLRADPGAMAEWEAIQKSLAPPDNFRMKVGHAKGGEGGGRRSSAALRRRPADPTPPTPLPRWWTSSAQARAPPPAALSATPAWWASRGGVLPPLLPAGAVQPRSPDRAPRRPVDAPPPISPPH